LQNHRSALVAFDESSGWQLNRFQKKEAWRQVSFPFRLSLSIHERAISTTCWWTCTTWTDVAGLSEKSDRTWRPSRPHAGPVHRSRQGFLDVDVFASPHGGDGDPGLQSPVAFDTHIVSLRRSRGQHRGSRAQERIEHGVLPDREHVDEAIAAQPTTRTRSSRLSLIGAN
jgi:hypothetical protein